MLKDLYSKKASLKSPKKSREQEESKDDEETKKKVMKLVQDEKDLKKGLRMQTINSMISNM